MQYFAYVDKKYYLIKIIMNQNLLNIQKIQGVKMCKVKNNK
jgi:hypothetical protein